MAISPIHYETVADLLASTRRFPAGVEVEAGGHRYAAAVAGAADYHLETVGGQKLYVKPVAQGYAAAAFGVDDSGASSAVAATNTARLQAAIDAAWKSGFGQVYLGRATFITTIDLRPGVVLVGGSSTADVGDADSFGGYRTGSGSWLIQVNGTAAPAVRHLRQSYAGDATPEMARGLGLRNVLVTTEGGAWSDSDHPVGVQLENCVFIVWEKVFVQGFKTNVILRECWDSTFIDLRTGPGDYGLRIDNFGDTDNSNNLKFLHPRLESWKRGGLKILSGGAAPRQNNKLDFFGMKNEGAPDANGESALEIDGCSEIRFWGGYCSITQSSTPPSTFTLLDIHATTQEMLGVSFRDFGLANNGAAGTIESMVRLRPGARNITGLHLGLLIDCTGATLIGNGILDPQAGTYRAIEIDVRRLYNPNARTLWSSTSNIARVQRQIRTPDNTLGSIYETVHLDQLMLRPLTAAPTVPSGRAIIAVADRATWDPANVGSGGAYPVINYGNGWVRLAEPPTAISAANLGSAANSINTTAKFAGRSARNTTDGKLYLATGATATSTWVSADGATTITPA